MLAHKLDGKYHTSYSNLLLAAQKLEWWAEARDPLPSKTIKMGGWNVTWPQTLGNLFPSRKLKSNCTFTAQSAIEESIGAAEDLSVKPEGEEEAESSDGEDPETSSGTGGADQPVNYIVHFTNAVKLYQKKNWNCFGCGSPDHLMRDCLKDLSKTSQRVSLNAKEGMAKKGGQAPQKPVVAQLVSLDKASKAWRCPRKLPSWTLIHLISGADLGT